MEHTAGRLAQLELQVLCEISQVLAQAFDLDRALDDILGILGERLAMRRATVTLVDDETTHLVIRASHGLSLEEKKRGVYRFNEGVTGRIFATAKPFVVPDVSKEPLFLDRTGTRKLDLDTLSFIGVPIFVHGAACGVLTVDRVFGEGVSYDEDIQFLTIVAGFISQIVSLNREIASREAGLRRENAGLRARLSKTAQRFFIVGQSAPMNRVHQMVEKVAPTKATVLLLGESGTGKTLISRIIHEISDRGKAPFIKVNCAAIPENLLESELFGHEKGAFTGATETKAGRFEEAHGGTIFLDEIGEVPAGIQAKLLRCLQEREFERLGSTKTRKVDVRIIAATNKKLSEEVAAGRFREDLFYRLNVFPITVPGLRERREDIPALLNHFLEKVYREYGRRLSFAPEALEALVDYDWPGNVREMENLVERLAIMAECDRIETADIPPAYLHGLPPERTVRARVCATGAVAGNLKDMERAQVLAALERHGFNQSRAAKDLGLTLRQMGYRVKKFGLGPAQGL